MFYQIGITVWKLFKKFLRWTKSQLSPLHSLDWSHRIFFLTFLIKCIYNHVFCPRAGPSLQAQEPRLEFCRRQVFHLKLRKQGCSFTRDWIGAEASRCFPHPTLSLVSGQIPKAPTWRWGQWIWLIGSSGLHRNSSQGLNISSIRIFDHIRDLEIPIILSQIHTSHLHVSAPWDIFRSFKVW